MNRIPSDVQFRLQVADGHELDFIASCYCNPPLSRKDGECDVSFRQRIVNSWEDNQ